MKILLILSFLVVILALSTAGAEFSTPSSCGRTACHMARDAHADSGCGAVESENLKLKTFRFDTALATERYVNKWLEKNSEIIIHCIQSHSTTLGSKVVYIWYKP